MLQGSPLGVLELAQIVQQMLPLKKHNVEQNITDLLIGNVLMLQDDSITFHSILDKTFVKLYLEKKD